MATLSQEALTKSGSLYLPVDFRRGSLSTAWQHYRERALSASSGCCFSLSLHLPEIPQSSSTENPRAPLVPQAPAMHSKKTISPAQRANASIQLPTPWLRKSRSLTRDARVSGRSQPDMDRENDNTSNEQHSLLTLFSSIRLPRLNMRHADLFGPSPLSQRPYPCYFLGPTDLVGSFRAKCTPDTPKSPTTKSAPSNSSFSSPPNPSLQTQPQTGGSVKLAMVTPRLATMTPRSHSASWAWSSSWWPSWVIATVTSTAALALAIATPDFFSGG